MIVQHPFAVVDHEQYAEVNPLTYVLVKSGTLTTGKVNRFSARNTAFRSGRMVGAPGPFHLAKVARARQFLLGEPGTADALDWLDRYLTVVDDVLYTVGSFDAPIAWRTTAGWTAPKVKYTYRTNLHQKYTHGLA